MILVSLWIGGEGGGGRRSGGGGAGDGDCAGENPAIGDGRGWRISVIVERRTSPAHN